MLKNIEQVCLPSSFGLSVVMNMQDHKWNSQKWSLWRAEQKVII